MGALLRIMYYSVGSMLLGVILTLAGIALMFFLIKSWRRNSTFTLSSFIVGGVLFFFLAFQSILLCGAVTIKSYGDDIEAAINSMVAGLPQETVLTQADSQQLLDAISSEWPLVGYYVNLADFRGHTPRTVAAAMADELDSYMNWYIFRRVCWSLLFVAVGAAVVIKTMDGKSGGRRVSSRRAPSTYRRIYDD